MTNSQKADKERFAEKQEFFEGILDPQTFAHNYSLRCYEPSEEMAPFIEHYFISRRRSDFDPEYIGYDVLSQPVFSLFIQPNVAFFQGPSIHRRTLRAKDSPIYTGAQFKPGGFYPFWQQRASDLTEKTVPAASIIPEIQDNFGTTFQQQDEAYILTAIDRVLCSAHPIYEPTIGLVNEIVACIENDHATSVPVLAKAFSMSERTLQQLFQIYVGVGIKWVIMRARFLEATKYIRAQATPDLTSIAAEFGYSDQSHFIKDFKKIVGLSPRQYRSLIKAHY